MKAKKPAQLHSSVAQACGGQEVGAQAHGDDGQRPPARVVDGVPQGGVGQRGHQAAVRDAAQIQVMGRDAQADQEEAELKIKEMALQQRADGENELAKIRQDLHERERLADKRSDTLEQQADQLRKQERMVEGNQRKLVEKKYAPQIEAMYR